MFIKNRISVLLLLFSVLNAEPTGFVKGKIIDINSQLPLVGANIVDIHYKFVDQKVVDRAHRYHLKIYVYSPNKKEDIDRLKSYGVDAIISDYPDRI